MRFKFFLIFLPLFLTLFLNLSSPDSVSFQQEEFYIEVTFTNDRHNQVTSDEGLNSFVNNGPIQHFVGEFSAQGLEESLALFTNPGIVNDSLTRQQFYIADIKEDYDNNVWVLAGFNITLIPEQQVSPLITIGSTSIPGFSGDWVGILLSYHQNNTLISGQLLPTPFNDDMVFSTMEIDQSNNIYILAASGPTVVKPNNQDFDNSEDIDVYLLKRDNLGTFTSVNLGGPGLDFLGGKSLFSMDNPTHISRFVIADLLELDSEGNLIFAMTTTSHSDEFVGSLNNTDPNGVSLYDPTWNATVKNVNSRDVFIGKVLSTDLSLEWSRFFSSYDSVNVGDVEVASLELDDQDRIYIGGKTNDTLYAFQSGEALIYPFADTKTGSGYGVNHQRTIHDGTNSEGFIAMFEKNGTLNTATYLGSNRTSYQGHTDDVFSLSYDNGKLWVGGTTWGADDFPIVGDVLSCYPTCFNWEVANGFIAAYNVNDWNMTFSTLIRPSADTYNQPDGFAVTEIQVISGYVLYSGLTRFFAGAEPTPEERFEVLYEQTSPNYFPIVGPNADPTFSVKFNGTDAENPEERDLSASVFGILNTTQDHIFFTNTDFGTDNSTHLQGTGRLQFLLANSSKVYIGFESLRRLSVQVLSVVDSDSDGLSDFNEANIWGTNPNIADTDGDGILDGDEVYGNNAGFFVTSPLLPDTDGDCIDDGLELANGLNPTFPDQNNDLDNDGINSFDEFHLGLDVNNNDTDDDGLDDYFEVFVSHTSGNNSDTDFDGLDDKFEWDNNFDPNDPDMDGDGLLDGTEYSTTYTFMYLNGTSILLKTDMFDVDTDNDGLNDRLEVNLIGFENETNPVMYDADWDLLSDYDELFTYGTRATAADYDGDGLNDTEEVVIYGTHPSEADVDGDTLNDLEEITLGTNPWVADIDQDGLNDSEEIFYGTDPYNADLDNDGLTDYYEVIFGSNYNNSDTDNDGLPDLYEYQIGLNATFDDSNFDYDGDSISTIFEYYNRTHPLFADIDNDNLNDLQEIIIGTDPYIGDTDNDGLLDDEIYVYGTNPFLSDTDADLLSDFYEVNNGLNATNQDEDSDGLIDGIEIQIGTGVTNNDTDSDGILDGEEYLILGSNPLAVDTDGDGYDDYTELTITNTSLILEDTDFDGLTDFEESTYNTDPLISDTDNDGVVDGIEVSNGFDPLDNDTDSDGLLDGIEYYVFETDPTLEDTDNDGMPDPWEVLYMFDNSEVQYMDPLTDDAAKDYDGDTLSNLREYELGLNPLRKDSDSGGVADNVELENGLDPLNPVDDVNLPLDESIREGFEENPVLFWATLLSGILGSGILLQMLIEYLRRRSEEEVTGNVTQEEY